MCKYNLAVFPLHKLHTQVEEEIKLNNLFTRCFYYCFSTSYRIHRCYQRDFYCIRSFLDNGIIYVREKKQRLNEHGVKCRSKYQQP